MLSFALLKRLIPMLAIFLCGSVACAMELPERNERPILTVYGRIVTAESGSSVAFDLNMLESLPVYELVTKTPWTDGEHAYHGVLMRDLLEKVGAEGEVVFAHALNDYSASIDRRIFDKYPIILAWRQDGRILTVRNKGPLWLVYPLSDFPELDTLQHHRDMVWQLNELEVR